MAEKYFVYAIEILVIKPDSNNILDTYPTKNQIYKIANIIKLYSGTVKLFVERCFSQMHVVLNDIGYKDYEKYFLFLGCGAAKNGYSIDVDGNYTPCRHLNIPESYDTLDEYLNNSKIVKIIIDAEKSKKEPYLSCHFNNYCKPCLAINQKLNPDIYIGHDMCDLYK